MAFRKRRLNRGRHNTRPNTRWAAQGHWNWRSWLRTVRGKTLRNSKERKHMVLASFTNLDFANPVPQRTQWDISKLSPQFSWEGTTLLLLWLWTVYGQNDQGRSVPLVGTHTVGLCMMFLQAVGEQPGWEQLGIPPRMPDLQPSPKNSSVAQAQDVDVQYRFQMSLCRKQCWVSSSTAPDEYEMVIMTYVNCAISHRAHSIAAGTAWHMHLVTLCNVYGKMHFSDTFLVILRFCGSPALQRD